MYRSERTVERLIRRLTREIEAIDRFFYVEDRDRSLYAAMLERKRDDMVRVAVLQLHTAIEDILTSWISCRMLGLRPEERSRRTRTIPARALRKLLLTLGFDRKLNLAVALKLISSKTEKQLEELNRLRNKCSHNWLLKSRVRRGRRPKERKPPLLLYRGRDLHNVVVLKDMLGSTVRSTRSYLSNILARCPRRERASGLRRGSTSVTAPA